MPIAAPLPVLVTITFPSWYTVDVLPSALRPVMVPPPVTEMLPDRRTISLQSLKIPVAELVGVLITMALLLAPTLILVAE